jgi:hypothetical protein
MLLVPMVTAGVISFAVLVLEEREWRFAERTTEAARAEFLNSRVGLNRFGAGKGRSGVTERWKIENKMMNDNLLLVGCTTHVTFFSERARAYS